MMKKIFTLAIFIMANIAGHAQQTQTFDVLTFSIPKNWQQKQFAGGVQYSITDKQTGGYAVALITQATVANAGATENFSLEWNRLVKAAVQVNEEPAMLDPTSDNGWEIISGTANVVYDNKKGLATLLTATGGGKTVSVVLMTNTDQFQPDLTLFLSSIELTKASSNTTTSIKTEPKGNSNNSSIVGLWVNYSGELVGFANGRALYSGGYIRKEYRFNNDGTYTYRQKNWLSVPTDFPFVYENGTWSVNGSELTITPKQVFSGRWKKLKNDPMLWGSKLKNTNWKMEKITYKLEITHNAESNSYGLRLRYGKPTERDGTANDYFGYSFREKGNTDIDNPPGYTN